MWGLDAYYVSAELLVRSRVHYSIDLVGLARGNPTWQTKVEGAYTGERFKIDWEQRVAHGSQGVASAIWRDYHNAAGKAYHLVYFPKAACQAYQAQSHKLWTAKSYVGLHFLRPVMASVE